MIKVAFLFDKSNNWIEDYFTSYLNKTSDMIFINFMILTKLENLI